MVDSNHEHLSLDFVDLINNPIGPAAGRPCAGKLSVQFMTDAFGRGDKGPQEKLGNRCCDLLGKPAKSPLGRRSDYQKPFGVHSLFR